MYIGLCKVVGCSNIRNRAPGVAFFYFPKDKSRRDLWITACGVEKANYNEVVCEIHFSPACFKPSGTSSRIRALRRTAVPDQQLPPAGTINGNAKKRAHLDVQDGNQISISRNVDALEGTCRLCNTTEPGIANLFEECPEKEEMSYSQQILEMFQLEIPELPNWPRSGCLDCIRLLNEMIAFKKRILERHFGLDEVHQQSMAMALKSPIELVREDPLGEDQPSEIVYLEDEATKAETSEVEVFEVIEEEDVISDPPSTATADIVPKLQTLEDQLQAPRKVFSANDQGTLPMKEVDFQKQIECETCLKSFKFAIHLRNHNRLHHPERREMPEIYETQCKYCAKVFASHFRLQVHIKRMHEKAYDHVCEQCGKAFTDVQYLKKHLLIHRRVSVPRYSRYGPRARQKGAIEQCDICLNWYRDVLQHKYKIHKFDHRLLDQTKWRLGKVICEKCGIYFNKSNIRAHLSRCGRAEDKGEPRQCQLCDKVFDQALSLKKHMFYHNVTRRFECSHCEFKSISKGNLWRHTRYSHPEEYKKCLEEAAATAGNFQSSNQGVDDDQGLEETETIIEEEIVIEEETENLN